MAALRAAFLFAENIMAQRLLKLAVIYLMAGMTLGLFMGITHRFEFHSVHAHINLLGWASLGLAALIFKLFPALAETRLATLYFWIYNLALPVGLAGLTLKVMGYDFAEPILGIGMTSVWAAGCLFGLNVLLNLSGARERIAAKPARGPAPRPTA
jgi:hypothetical protein